MNFTKKLAVLALVAIMLAAAPAQAQYHTEISPLFDQMNVIGQIGHSATNGMRRALNMPDRPYQPLFNDRLVVANQPVYHGSRYRGGYQQQPYYNDGSSYYLNQVRIPTHLQGTHPCDLPLEYRPRYGSDTPDCGQRTATERSVNTWGAIGTIASLAGDYMVIRTMNKNAEKIVDALTMNLEAKDLQEGPAAQTPIRPQIVSTQQQPQGSSEVEIEVLNCTQKDVVLFTQKESWRIPADASETRTIKVRYGIHNLKATYGGDRKGRVLLDESGVIVIQPATTR